MTHHSHQLTIELKQVRLYGYHGLYENESFTGNEFEIDLHVRIEPTVAVIRNIDESISYVNLFELLKKRMQQSEALLETLAMEIANLIHKEYTGVKEVTISITKITPPFENFSGKVGVTYQKSF
ncbi:MAG: dihydroneopterin aldolase [Chitinophagaceae bacterium]|jgi:dihydroneopterin aldolase|nr:dihydroneopterin aldolase [Chitinophagaceae bacterium]